jgi:hypothetical protein
MNTGLFPNSVIYAAWGACAEEIRNIFSFNIVIIFFQLHYFSLFVLVRPTYNFNLRTAQKKIRNHYFIQKVPAPSNKFTQIWKPYTIFLIHKQCKSCVLSIFVKRFFGFFQCSITKDTLYIQDDKIIFVPEEREELMRVFVKSFEINLKNHIHVCLDITYIM